GTPRRACGLMWAPTARTTTSPALDACGPIGLHTRVGDRSGEGLMMMQRALVFGSVLAGALSLLACEAASDSPVNPSGGAGSGSATGAAGTGSGTGAAGTGSGTGAAGTGSATGAAGPGSGTGAGGTRSAERACAQ